MGLFDRAKNSFTERFGDEVIRKGNFGAREEETEAPDQSQSERAPRLKRQPKVKPPREPKPARDLPEEPEEFQDGAFDFEDEADAIRVNESYDFPEPEPARSHTTTSSVIDRDELSKLAKSEGQSVADILKSFRIKETFTIDDGILFLDEELANQNFATQAPYGYDMGEVDFFLAKTQRSVAEYVRLLRIRNDDVVNLATRLSDLMVEINNMRFNAEVANGINIMASGGDDDAIAVELQEARAKCARLQDELNRLQNGAHTPVRVNQNELESLRNELSAERIARERSEKEAQDLRAHLLLIEEEHDIQVFSDHGELHSPISAGYDSGYESYEEQRSEQFQSVNVQNRAQDELYAEERSYQSVGRDHWLPSLEEEEGLPVLADEEEGLPDGNFAFEEEGLEDIALDSFEGSDGTFDQSDGRFENSGFTANPYQNLDEFIEENLEGFPEDNSSTVDSGGKGLLFDEEDPDNDGFEYSFERNI